MKPVSERGTAVIVVTYETGQEVSYQEKNTTYEGAMRSASRLMNDHGIVDVDVDFLPQARQTVRLS